MHELDDTNDKQIIWVDDQAHRVSYERCKPCLGTGEDAFGLCPDCKGHGGVLVPVHTQISLLGDIYDGDFARCPECGGYFNERRYRPADDDDDLCPSCYDFINAPTEYWDEYDEEEEWEDEDWEDEAQ